MPRRTSRRLLRKYAMLKMFPGAADAGGRRRRATWRRSRRAAAGMCLVGTPESVVAELGALPRRRCRSDPVPTGARRHARRASDPHHRAGRRASAASTERARRNDRVNVDDPNTSDLVIVGPDECIRNPDEQTRGHGAPQRRHARDRRQREPVVRSRDHARRRGQRAPTTTVMPSRPSTCSAAAPASAGGRAWSMSASPGPATSSTCRRTSSTARRTCRRTSRSCSSSRATPAP